MSSWEIYKHLKNNIIAITSSKQSVVYTRLETLFGLPVKSCNWSRILPPEICRGLSSAVGKDTFIIIFNFTNPITPEESRKWQVASRQAIKPLFLVLIYLGIILSLFEERFRSL